MRSGVMQTPSPEARTAAAHLGPKAISIDPQPAARSPLGLPLWSSPLYRTSDARQ